MPTTHKCPHEYCQVQCPRNRVACREHWSLVSPDTRKELFEEYVSKGGTGRYFELHDRAVKEMNSA